MYDRPGVVCRWLVLWPVAMIAGTSAAAIAYFQLFGVIDNGTSNTLSAAAVLLGLLALGVWMALWAPFSRLTRRRCVAAAMASISGLILLVRTDGFDGNFRPIIRWRWESKPEAELNKTSRITAVHAPIECKPTKHDYPGFLGRRRNGYVHGVELATDWCAESPKLLWTQPIGGGYSGFAIVGDAAFTLEQQGEEELVTCYDVNTGKLVWFDAITARHHDTLGGDGPCSTPTVYRGRVYALGGTGVLRCLDVATGKRIWMRDVLADVGTDAETDHASVPWGRSGSPLAYDNLVVVPGGGPPSGPKTSLIAYKKTNGEILWKGGNREVSYSSPSLVTYGGVRQVVIVNEATITGHDPNKGDVLWEVPWDGSSSSRASASQTVQLADNRFFVSKGYSMGGGAVFRIKPKPTGGWVKKKLWHNHRVLMTKFSNVIVKSGYAYGLSDGVLQCVDLKDGKRCWSGDDYGHGQLMRIGNNVLLVMSEDGIVALVAMDPIAFQELTQIQALEGKTWNNPALSGHRLLVRNDQEAACYELPLANTAM